MPDYYVHDAGYNIKQGITKSDFDGLQGQVSSLSNKVNSIASGGYGATVIYNNGNDLAKCFDKPNGLSDEKLLFEGIITAYIDDSYRTARLHGVTSFKNYALNDNDDPVAFWGLRLDTLYDNRHLNIPIFTHKANSDGIIGWDTPFRNLKWYFEVPDRPTIADFPSQSDHDFHWIGNIEYYKSGIGEDAGAQYRHKNLNGLMGCFSLEKDSNNVEWLVPGAVRMLDATEAGWWPVPGTNPPQSRELGLQKVPYTCKNIAALLNEGGEPIPPVGPNTVTMVWDVTLNIKHPGGD